MGKILRKEKLQEAAVRLRRDHGDRAKTTTVESARTHHVILGILPYVTITKQNRDTDSEKCAYMHREVARSWLSLVLSVVYGVDTM